MQAAVITQTATFASETCPSLNAQHQAYLLGYLSFIDFGFICGEEIWDHRRNILPILGQYGDYELNDVFRFLQEHPLVLAKSAE
jgi:hypothetical protein